MHTSKLITYAFSSPYSQSTHHSQPLIHRMAIVTMVCDADEDKLIEYAFVRESSEPFVSY